jgi:hypothetical protein
MAPDYLIVRAKQNSQFCIRSGRWHRVGRPMQVRRLWRAGVLALFVAQAGLAGADGGLGPVADLELREDG